MTAEEKAAIRAMFRPAWSLPGEAIFCWLGPDLDGFYGMPVPRVRDLLTTAERYWRWRQAREVVMADRHVVTRADDATGGLTWTSTK